MYIKPGLINLLDTLDWPFLCIVYPFFFHVTLWVVIFIFIYVLMLNNGINNCYLFKGKIQAKKKEKKIMHFQILNCVSKAKISYF